MKIITRSQWGARAPRSVRSVSWSQRTAVVFHHGTGTEDVAGSDAALVRGYQNHHMDNRRWDDIGYNWLIGVGGDDDGYVYEGRGNLVIGAHCSGFNTASIGICFIGDFRPGKSVLTPKAKAAALELYQDICRRAGRKLKVYGHGSAPGQNTTCPGGQVMAWISNGLPLAPAPTPVIPTKTWMEDVVDNLPTLKKGKKGEDVQSAQHLLLARGQKLKQYGADGDFGDETVAAVKRFQESRGLTKDGVVGKNTWTKLLLVG